MAGAAGFAFPLHCTALVYPDLYVYACRSIAHPFQHALAVLVWRPVLKFLFCETPTGVYILGGICGGILYMAAYNIFPYFQPMTEYSFMLGHRHLFLRSLLQQPTGNPTTRYAFSFSERYA